VTNSLRKRTGTFFARRVFFSQYREPRAANRKWAADWPSLVLAGVPICAEFVVRRATVGGKVHCINSVVYLGTSR